MNLGFNISFAELGTLDGLKKIDSLFCQFLGNESIELHNQLIAYRNGAEVDPLEYSQFIIDASFILDDFLEKLFAVQKENLLLKQQYISFDVIHECRRKFVQRFAAIRYPKHRLAEIDFEQVSEQLRQLLGKITEHNFAAKALIWQSEPEKYAEELDIAARYAALMAHSSSSLTLFSLPKRIDPENLIPEIIKGDDPYLGFNCRDRDLTLEQAASNSRYCIYCHRQGKDSCSKGLPAEPETKKGCPLKQKISEMNLVNSKGFNIAALGIIVIDNPVVAATGHRICNDCMKACIFQKQEPVNIPLVETKILENVLGLPYGVEIYLLLTKWNPLNIVSPLPKNPTGHNVLVTGLGPAGFALSHYLLNDGHNVTAIDGLKITPLPFDFKSPVRNWSDIMVPLSEKIPQGFGGVMEYGITSRWDKNRLTLIRLILERRENFNMYGGLRLGSNITTEQAFQLGFDHIALCIGAGAPKFLNFKGAFAKGVRTATDFLMSLQQGGAFLAGSQTNLAIRMPAAVIGLGLTAVDSAVEIIHYYPKQVSEFARKYEKSSGSDRARLTMEEIKIAEELVAHAGLFKLAKNDKEKLDIINQLGGVTICYRGRIKDSPAYLLNHEEIIHAMAIGVQFKEEAVPDEIITDDDRYTRAIKFTDGSILPAKTVLIAVGTEKNDQITASSSRLSYFGDCNQKYSGSVVKALASAREGFPVISENLSASRPNYIGDFSSFSLNVSKLLKSRIKEINLLTENIVEVIIHSPLAARNFKPGQFFRLQNYSDNPAELIEPIALTGAGVSEEEGTVSLIILEMGRSSRLCRKLSVGEEVILMGPAGEPTEIVPESKVVLIGGGLGNAALLPIAKALRDAGSKVIYFAGYRKRQDQFYAEKIEEVSDIVVWSCEEGVLPTNRATDLSIAGNVIDGINLAKKHKILGHKILGDVSRVICIGSNRMMGAISRNKKLLFGEDIPLICSINSPMQCMMKGICGQCIQKTDNVKGYIFSCACQDQMDQIIDFEVLSDRLAQNSLFEKI